MNNERNQTFTLMRFDEEIIIFIQQNELHKMKVYATPRPTPTRFYALVSSENPRLAGFLRQYRAHLYAVKERDRIENCTECCYQQIIPGTQ